MRVSDMDLRICMLLDRYRERVAWGIEQQVKGKWYGWRQVGFDLRYDACFFLAMLREIAGRPKSKKQGKRAIRRPRTVKLTPKAGDTR